MFAVVVGVLLFSPAWAQAASEDKAKAREKTARKACLAGDVAKGAGLLADLFVETGNATYVYNQARCYEQNHRYEDAISRYREFLKISHGLSERDRTKVDKAIEDCQKLLPPAAPVVEAAPAPVPVAPVPEVVAPSPVVASVPVTAAAPAPTPRSDNRGLRIAGLVSGAVGVASIGVGIYFYTRARSLSDTITNADEPKGSDYRAGKRAETMQWVFYGVGAAALVTGSILYYLGWPSSESSQTAVAPVIGPSMAGIAARGAF